MPERGAEFRPPREPGLVLLRVSAAASVAGILLLFIMITAFALPVFSGGEGGGPFSWEWAPGKGRFGILPMAAASLALGAFALAAGWPLAFSLCCWLLCPETASGRASSAARRFVGAVVRIMTAIPTVVYGFAAVFMLTPLIRRGFGGSGLCLLTASIMLCFLVLPTVVLVLQAGLGKRLDEVAMAGRALGMSRMELLWHFVLPRARGTLLASAILAFGRAVGDTMLPLMLAGCAPVTPSSLLSGARSLTAHMALVTSNEVGGSAYDSLFMTGLLLLAVNAAVSLAMRRLEKKI